MILTGEIVAILKFIVFNFWNLENGMGWYTCVSRQLQFLKHLAGGDAHCESNSSETTPASK